ARIEELEKNSADTSAENAELKARVAKLEQESRQPQNDFSPKEHVDITESITVHSPACETNDAVPEVQLSIDNPVPASSKPSEDRKTVAFLVEANKKNVSDSIRQRNREKKLCTAPFDQRESSEVALEVVTPITSDQTGSHDADSLSPSSSLENNHISLSSSQANSSLPVIRKIPYNQKVEQGIIQEVISFIQKRVLISSINILESREIETVPGEGRDLAQLYSDAKVAEVNAPPADLDDYINMLTGSLDNETANWGTPYENSAIIGKEEANEVKGVPRVQSDDDVYFDKEIDSTPQSVKETNEEVASQSVKTDDDSDCNRDSDSEEEMPDDSDDDGYDGYGGYNVYGERDRGCYYRDGRYERKVSPMMSPIISPVTA
ncbi:hypothetical protein RhiirC2_722143, partial [Rhizophagus irregularis]